MPERVTIDRLGHRGDGIAQTANGQVFVPYALPGETVLIERAGARGRLIEVAEPAAGRVAPFCPYFGTCGGCISQHMDAAAYAAWKRGTVADALAKAGLPSTTEPLVDAHGDGRRRITLHARMRAGRVQVGFMAARSHDLVAIASCPVTEPRLTPAPRTALALARLLAGAGKPVDIQVSASEAGLDVDIRGNGEPDRTTRMALVEAASRLDLARLSLHGDILVERRAPMVTMGRSRVVPPPGAFLQASARAEEVLASLVLAGSEGARRVADLFAGCGPFALRLAQRCEVHAVEGDARAVAALDRAARQTSGLRRVTSEARDLFRRPLLAAELDRFDALVMDPPRAGAEAQARQLAQSKVPRLISVSCDAGTFARDAAILVGGGYRLERVIPVDQFKYGAPIEIVGFFRREHPGKRR